MFLFAIRTDRRNNNRKRLILFTVSVLLIIAGVLLLVSRIIMLREAATREWKTTPGKIIETSIVGERAFHPRVKYSYRVDNKEYSNVTDLGMPGFGGKRNRLETSEILIEEYPVGKVVIVYYDSNNPANSCLHKQVGYGIYIQLALGSILFLSGLGLIIIWFGRPVNH